MKDLKTYYGLFRDWHFYSCLKSEQAKKNINELIHCSRTQTFNINEPYDTILVIPETFFFMKDKFGVYYGKYIHEPNSKEISYDNFIKTVLQFQNDPLELFKRTNILTLDKNFQSNVFENDELLVNTITDTTLIILKKIKTAISIQSNEGFSIMTPLNGEVSPDKTIEKIVVYDL